MTLLIKWLKKIKSIKFCFFIPAKKDILIYDREGSTFLSDCFSEFPVFVLDVRKESINLFVLLKAFKSGNFTYTDYLNTYIAIVDPKVIITFIDNNPNFYLLKKSFNSKTFAFIQNGTRGEIGDIFGNVEPNSDFSVDYMFVHGEAIGKKYESLIKGKSIAIGSFKNNLVKIKNKESCNKKSLLFISTYIIPPVIDSNPIWVEKNGTPTYWSQFYEAEKLILPFLKNYCRENHIDLKICGRLTQGLEQEKNYYSGFLNGCNWSFLERKGTFSSYEYVDLADVVVNIDSTIGYEALGRGKKVAFFTIRGESLKNTATKFGWPGKFPEEGEYWVNDHSEENYKKILDRLFSQSQTEYANIINEYRSQIMNYDFENKIFRQIILEKLKN